MVLENNKAKIIKPSMNRYSLSSHPNLTDSVAYINRNDRINLINNLYWIREYSILLYNIMDVNK